MYPAVTDEGSVSFRMIDRESGKPIKYQKGIETESGFKQVPDAEIIKGYEYGKGHYALIKPEEIEDLKLEAKHTIDLARFVDEDDIEPIFWEKPYYLVPDTDDGLEGYTVLRNALRDTGKVAVGQLIMHGHEHLVGIRALGKGLLLEILRYAHEVHEPEPHFERITKKPKQEAVKLAEELIEKASGPFEPESMPNEYAQAVHELVRAKIEQRAPHIELAEEKAPKAPVINIMDALKKAVQAKGHEKVQGAVRRRMGEKAPKVQATAPKRRPERRPSRTTH
jgi:DNA end-binding protein Ku